MDVQSYRATNLRTRRSGEGRSYRTSFRTSFLLLQQDISKLLSLAAASMALLTLPQTDGPEHELPSGGERSEQFVLEVSKYFERLDVSTLCLLYVIQTFTAGLQSIHIAIRSSLAHIRQSRIAPSAINAPPPGFIPPALGVGVPSADGDYSKGTRGLQEERIERDAWRAILDALTRLKEAKERESAEVMQTTVNE